MLHATKGILRANSADREGGLFTASFTYRNLGRFEM
jgi:hypothetical protein